MKPMQTVRKVLAAAALAGAALPVISLSSCGNQSMMESPGQRTPLTSRPSWDEQDEWENGSTSRSPKSASKKRSRTGSGTRGREYIAAAEDENGETAEAEAPRRGAAGRNGSSGTSTAKSSQQ